MVKEKLERVRISIIGFNSKILNICCNKISQVGRETNSTVYGPIFLPTKRRIYCVLRSPHVDKDSREHFEVRTHKRIFDIWTNTKESFLKIEMPRGAFFDIKLNN
uniref:ribosomal protein S10 n=1 Tax=Haramonas pauciplastida TaxID=478668 RepID=UPI00211440E9|nr:ribosomal protein S10 [Haramonas pauciplastida]UTE94953.1 ribosomal protein S10 [Haramonas pauciplastida]